MHGLEYERSAVGGDMGYVTAQLGFSGRGVLLCASFVTPVVFAFSLGCTAYRSALWGALAMVG